MTGLFLFMLYVVLMPQLNEPDGFFAITLFYFEIINTRHIIIAKEEQAG